MRSESQEKKICAVAGKGTGTWMRVENRGEIVKYLPSARITDSLCYRLTSETRIERISR